MLFTTEQLPHDAFTRAASLSFFLFIIAVSVLWLAVKIVLWAHGERRWFVLHTRDLRKLKFLAAQEADSPTRLCYDLLRYALHTCFVLLFVVPLTLLAISSFSRHSH